MVRSLLLASLAIGCVTEPAVDQGSQDVTSSFTREHVVGDIYHYQLVLRVGATPNAGIRVHRVVRERAPFVPRPTVRAAMLLHGDFSTFVTNFVPVLGDPSSPVEGLAPYLAARDIDVWGVDRRWTLAATDGDVTDFGEMGLAQDLDDVRAALALARSTRAATGQGGGPLALVGFSHGGQLAFTYAAVEGGRPAAQRHVDAIVPLDFYGAIAPEDTELRTATCASAAGTYEWIGAGSVDSPNDFLIAVGQLARVAPADPSPIFDGLTNADAMRIVVGQTYLFAPFAPLYHLAAPVLEDDFPVALRESSDAAIEAWLEGATPHQALLESADLDAQLCGDAPAVDAPLSQIHVPMLYVGAAGGVGDNGLYATTQVGSTDVTAQVVRRFDPSRRAEDFGHADLLFATDAPALVWEPIAGWLLHH